MAVEKSSDHRHGINYKQVEKSSTFRQLISEKKKFIIPCSIFFLIFYFSLPTLASYTTVLDGDAIGGVITWAWVLAFAQFVMTWTLCILYTRKAAHFDQLAQKVLNEEGEPRK
ncbi:DUF485 domain-containing protein [Salicibibacter halophilus]|uniref:DUF485 domain-containing protein n=1 Tax=Salicibibacter halophilus TaxID=2502791 RepID=A0A514LGL4_9BACI|nr:DUF485 domain-containing protein [Salicibibacter halophilus]QDI90993.1 DUF485 domain-containing protein [Salicibibacter halophilus]